MTRADDARRRAALARETGGVCLYGPGPLTEGDASAVRQFAAWLKDGSPRDCAYARGEGAYAGEKTARDGRK
jgi:hypothetical protein